MINRNFCMVALCVLLIIANRIGFSIYLRITFGAIGIMLLIDVIARIRQFMSEDEKYAEE